MLVYRFALNSDLNELGLRRFPHTDIVVSAFSAAAGIQLVAVLDSDLAGAGLATTLILFHLPLIFYSITLSYVIAIMYWRTTFRVDTKKPDAALAFIAAIFFLIISFVSVSAVLRANLVD